GLGDRIEHAHRDEIGAGEYRGGPRPALEQLFGTHVSTVARVAGGHDVDLLGQATGAHGLPVAFGTDCVGHLDEPVRIGLVMIDVRDPAMAEVGQVLDDQGGAGVVVVGDHVESGGTAVPADHDG